MTIDLSEGVNWAKVSDLLEQFRTILEVGLDTGTATGGSSTTLEDTSKNWGTDAWKDAYIEIVEGTGAGQIRKISSNTSNTITVATAWSTTPDSTSKYRIFGAPSEVRVLNDILGQLDITLSAFRDALRGTDSKTLTDIHNDLYSYTDAKSAYDQLKSILGQLNITLSALRDAITTGSTSGATAKALYDLYSDLESLKKALASIGTDKLLTTPDNPSNLDIALSVHRDAIIGSDKKSLTDVINKFTPEHKTNLFNTVVAANTNIISDIPITKDVVIRITVSVDPSAVFNVNLTSGVSKILSLNGGSALTANALYTFDVPLYAGITLNLQAGAGTTINILNVQQVEAMSV